MPALNSLQVLLVDDNASMRAIASAVLQSAGIRHIREAEDGVAALKCLHEEPIDLAMVDFAMAGLDGVEFTRLVRNSPDSPNPFLPIIMMTGHAGKTRVYEARDAGVTEFLVKPITARAVLDRINAVICQPRPFVRTDGYFGPDRRRVAPDGYRGPLRRRGDQEIEPFRPE